MKRPISRRRLFGTAGSAAAAAAAAVIADVAVPDLPDAVAAPTGIGIFDYAIEGNDEPLSEHDALARWRPGRFDMVIAQRFMLASLWEKVRAANPALLWGVYTNGTHTDRRYHAPPFYPHDWYAWSAAGNPVASLAFPDNLLMNPRSGWKGYTEDRAAGLVADSAANGVYVDELGVGPIYSTDAPPIDPDTGKTWTWGDWMTEMDRACDGYRAAVPGTQVITNGLGNGFRYESAPTSTMLDHCDAALAESFLRGSDQPASYYPTPTTYERDVRMIADGGSKLMACTKIWTGDAPVRARVLRWALGSFLLGAAGGARWYSTAERATTVTPWRTEWSAAKRLGAPLGPRSGVTRLFEGGSVRVDNISHDATFTLA